MIDPSLLGRTMRWSVVASFLLAGIAFIGGRFATGFGVLAGGALGLVPILTWAWLIGPLMKGGRGLLVAALMLAKVILYGAALYLLVAKERVDVAAFAMAFLVPHLAMALAASRPPATTEANA